MPYFFTFGLHRQETEKLIPKFNPQNSTQKFTIEQKVAVPVLCLCSAHTYGRWTSGLNDYSWSTTPAEPRRRKTTTNTTGRQCPHRASSWDDHRVLQQHIISALHVINNYSCPARDDEIRVRIKAAVVSATTKIHHLFRRTQHVIKRDPTMFRLNSARTLY